MKKIFRYAAMICAAALAVACAEEPQDEPIVEHPTTKDMTFTTEAATPDSRVLFADGEGLAWENADLTKMAVCYDEAGAWKHTCSTSGAINEGTATFTATVDAESVFAYCYYPYAENSATDATFAYNFAAALTQAEAGKTTDFRLASDVISIEGEVTNVSAQFRVVGSLLRYFIYAEASEESVQSVALKASAPVAGIYTYDLATAEGEVGGTTSNEVTVTLGTALSLEGITAADKAKSVFMPIVPATSEGVTYVVTTDKNVYEFTSTAAHTWAEGAVTEIKLNLAKATNVTPIGGGEGPDTSNATEIIYCFTNMAVQTTYNFPATEGVAATDYYIVDEGEFGNHIFDYTKPYYTTMRMEYLDATSNEVVDWVTLSTRANDNKLDFAYQANSGAERTAIINIYWDDTEEYKVVGTYKKADKSYEEITTADPIMTITVTQAAGAVTPDPEPDPSGATELTYHFTNKAMRTSYDVAANEGAAATDYFIVALNGVDNIEYSKPYYTDLRMEYLDEEGNKVDWITFTTRANDNKLDYSWTTNEGAARTAVVNIYWDDTEEYKVVGTVKNDAKELEAITTTDPIMTIKLNQAAGAATPDPEPDPSGATEIIYKFTFQGMPAINFDIAANGVTDQDLQWFSAIIGGTDTADPSKAPITGWRYVATDNEGNEVDWLSIRHQNNNRIYLTCQANKAEARVATINLYWDDTAEYKVVGTYKQAAPNHQVLEEITTNDPILTLTVNQAAGNGGPTEIVYQFTNKGIGQLEFNVANGSGEIDPGWYGVLVNGQSLGKGAFVTDWRYEAVDAEGNPVEWIVAEVSPKEDNRFALYYEANTAEARTAIINFYWDDTDEYKVVGTHKTPGGALTEITTADPILTLTVNQAAGN